MNIYTIESTTNEKYDSRIKEQHPELFLIRTRYDRIVLIDANTGESFIRTSKVQSVEHTAEYTIVNTANSVYKFKLVSEIADI